MSCFPIFANLCLSLAINHALHSMKFYIAFFSDQKVEGAKQLL